MNTGKWYFTDDKGTFRWENPEYINELYFPLCNEAGMMSSITPMLHGDIKTGQHQFLMAPVTVEDLHNTKSARNFWVYVQGKGPWSATGNSVEQIARRFGKDEETERVVEAGLLWHKVIFRDKRMGLASEILSFVPASDDRVEIMQVTIINESKEEYRITPTSAIPIFGRSAENIRDHRHVTSLVNRIEKLPCGITLKPEILFDEYGHKYNDTTYYVIGSEGDGSLPAGSFPSVRSFIGDRGDFQWPEAVVSSLKPENFQDENLDGKECVGALRFTDAVLRPGEKAVYILLLGICNNRSAITEVLERYNTCEKIERYLKENQEFWKAKVEKNVFESGIQEFSNWMKWVSVQPTLRKIYGCSFLPYHDYGKGGRGWRDLWQDCLSLIIQNPQEVRGQLVNNFAGVRTDGSNATIIGAKPGEFIADRNRISRVWMDHGAWPYLTVKLYIDQSNDMYILLENQTYFKDGQVKRAAGKDESWMPELGSKLRTAEGEVYQGTVMEHLLVQHLTSFFNVGEHNNIRLEGADWNDTLDMASKRGESVAFTALYGSNLISLSKLLLHFKESTGRSKIEVFEELEHLLDSLHNQPDYSSIEYKLKVLNSYFDRVSQCVSGIKKEIAIEELAADLQRKGEWIFTHVREKEWIDTGDGSGCFNGYYNNDGQRVDGVEADGVRMNLTAQVFTTMYGLASEDQVLKAYEACRKYLKDPYTGGYRLNTSLGEHKLNFGRGFAFAYGEKENGATFCHMVLMYVNALYKRGFAKEAYEVFKSLYDLSNDRVKSKIYPGVPEYFSAEAKGMYHYLTGTASWLLLTVLTEMYGVRGEDGYFIVQPKLMPEQYDEEGKAVVRTVFAGKRVEVQYVNEPKADFQQASIGKALFNGKDIGEFITDNRSIRIPLEHFASLASAPENTLKVYLGSRKQ